MALFRGCEAPLGLDIWWRVDRLGTYGPVLSCQTFNVTASRWPNPMVPTRYWKHPGTAAGSPGVYRAGLWGWAVTDVPRYPGYKTPTNVIKYDDKTNPSVWLVDYHLACKAGGVEDDLFIIQFLPIYLADSAQAWLDHLPRNVIDS
jgi:hypothetical protein